ncbi:MAG: ATP-dependent RecD-like DNA helicase [Oscillospiraceae bacterium]|nr:ATP-dependent RecD-like DNA helicase [Oscillospiraceae bacterium]
MEKIEGQVASVIYYNDENGYAVLRLNVDDGSSTIVVGCIPLAVPGESLTAWGAWGRHPSHGEQFKAQHTERVMPTDASAIFDYLSSRTVKGIGPATAAAIVAQFGDDSLNVIRDHPEKLAAMKGIGRKKAEEISAAFRQQTGMRLLMEFLGSAELPPILALRLYRYYGDEALEQVKENPYILSSVQIGASFAQADALALAQGIESDAPERIAAALLFELRHNADNGHCFLPADKLTAATAQLIGVEAEQIQEGLDILLDSGEVIREQVANADACYLAGLYAAEVYTAHRLREMAVHTYENTHASAKRVIEKLEAEQRITLSSLQKSAVEAAASRQLLVITGGPGTGKTTSVRAVLALFDALELDTFLAAPTGQAAKRMSALTGREASTIHRLLEANFSPETDSVTFRKNEKDRLRCGALVLDECSMVDITLMRAVLAAIGPACRLVLVGDADQLPSVGPGSVFRDIIRSGVAETVRLTEIFRQKEESRIILCAHQINHGQMPDLRVNQGGFYFMRRRDSEQTAQTIVELCSHRLPDNMGIPASQIQVLSPTRKGPAGTENLNQLLQEALNPWASGKPEFSYAGRIYRTGDRVMQIRNDYDIMWKTQEMETGYGIYNGDIGFIHSIDPAGEVLTIDFDGRMAEYSYEQASELEHAWAMTVHKSQGSEYRAVVFSAARAAAQLMYRSLLYTAVTRASELLVAVGDDQVIQIMTENARRTKRYSGLRIRMADGQ